jgi:UrcA family protein
MTILLFLASLAAGPAALAARADEQTGPSAIVRIDDLDLTSPAGRATLDRRVKRAVNRVCSVAGPTRPTDFDAVSACRDQALNDASRQIQLALGASTHVSELWASK